MTYVFNISDQYKSDDRWFMLEISLQWKILQILIKNGTSYFCNSCTISTRVARILSLTATAISVQLLFTANSNSDHI